MTWEMDLVVVVSILSVINMAFNIHNSYRAHKERKNAPDKKLREEFELYKTKVDNMENKKDNLKQFQKVMLSATNGILQQLSTDNQSNEMKSIEREIYDFLKDLI